jgi:NAD(P)-dependent dehydrogenase (short-subunit alcohol dehydrogenase family)
MPAPRPAEALGEGAGIRHAAAVSRWLYGQSPETGTAETTYLGESDEGAQTNVETNGKLVGQVALVTGGARNIGRQVALTFADEGADVAITARTPEQVDETVGLVRARGRRAFGMAGDLRDPDQAFALAEAVERELGPIDVLVNAVGGSAGTMPTFLGPGGERPDVALWQDILELNLLTVVHTCAAVAPHMVARRRGRIINFGGGSGGTSDLRHAPPGVRPFSPYSTAKAAVLRFSELLAWELGEHGIQVNTLGPGLVPARQAKRDVRGEWLPLPTGPQAARARGPEDAARLALFLASADATGLNGRHLDVSQDWPALAGHIAEVMATDRFTMKRIG